MKSENEALECLKPYEAMATAHFQTRMSRLRCDNGDESSGKQVKTLCRQKGIQLEITVPYSPEQNGSSERMNRTKLSAKWILCREWQKGVVCSRRRVQRIQDELR